MALTNVFDWNNPDLYFLICLSFVNAVLLCFLSYKFMQIIQLSNYNIKHYNIWLRDTKAKWVSRLVMVAFLSFCCVLVTCILFSEKMSHSKLVGYLGLIFYFALSITFVVEMLKIPQKKPLKMTKRMFRLFVFTFLLYLIITFALLVLALQLSYYVRSSVLALTPLCVPVIVPLACLLANPIEKLIYNSYKHRAKRELEKHDNLIKIGITGSYGKTSTKQFLAKLLEDKFNVVATPSSFNTPMGISKTVFAELKDDTQVFIAEMGAKQVGDIKELCQMVKPNFAIITGVVEQHLETFGSLDNIIKTKSELYQSLGADDICVFDISNENTKKMFDECALKNKIAVGGDSDFLRAENIFASSEGIGFDIVYNGKSYPAKTKILGEHNVQDILLAVAIALKLGVKIKEIQKSIAQIKPVEHRLELKKLPNDITLIDDSFNSNIVGTASALKTLALFENANRKIIVTPGLVELGEREAIENQELGRNIAKICDVAILVNKNQSENIKKGLLQEGFDPQNIIYQETLFDVTNLFKTFLQSGDVILMENDLPDNYK